MLDFVSHVNKAKSQKCDNFGIQVFKFSWFSATVIIEVKVNNKIIYIWGGDLYAE